MKERVMDINILKFQFPCAFEEELEQKKGFLNEFLAMKFLVSSYILTKYLLIKCTWKSQTSYWSWHLKFWSKWRMVKIWKILKEPEMDQVRWIWPHMITIVIRSTLFVNSSFTRDFEGKTYCPRNMVKVNESSKIFAYDVR